MASNNNFELSGGCLRDKFRGGFCPVIGPLAEVPVPISLVGLALYFKRGFFAVAGVERG